MRRVRHWHQPHGKKGTVKKIVRLDEQLARLGCTRGTEVLEPVQRDGAVWVDGYGYKSKKEAAINGPKDETAHPSSI